MNISDSEPRTMHENVLSPAVSSKGRINFAEPSGALHFSGREWTTLAGLYGFIALLHVVGWGAYLHFSPQYTALAGLGFAAYMLGLRHAFDADHIAAVDDTVRYLVQKGKQPLGVGFFFSLGHSTIVVSLAVATIFAATWIKQELPELKAVGGVIGASISGLFLWFIGLLNLFVLLDILKVWRAARNGKHTHAHLEELLHRRGLLNRLFGGRLQKLIEHSWQMYPLGLLFGLGFDTASEIGLLAMTAIASTADLPVPAVLSLPVLFAAGMSAMDTTDGVLMVKAYNWAFVNPLRKIFYNLTTTGLSIAVALVIGTLELMQVLAGIFDLQGPIFNMIRQFDFGALGYVIVGLFLSAWAISILVWKFAGVEKRYGEQSQTEHVHEHRHDGMGSHSHSHFH